MIFTRYDKSKCQTKEELETIEQISKSVKLANLLDHGIECFRALGISRDGEVFCRYKKLVMTIESHNAGDSEAVLLKNVWIPKAYRSQGEFREFIRQLKSYCFDKNLGIVAVSNPTECDDFDVLDYQWLGMRYVNNEEQRDRLGNFFLYEGFKEANPASMVQDFYAFLVRVVRDYDGLIPRWFLFNLDEYASDDILPEEAIKARFPHIKKVLEESPEQFDVTGQKVNSIYS